jgi:hypothetical protein
LASGIMGPRVKPGEEEEGRRRTPPASAEPDS